MAIFTAEELAAHAKGFGRRFDDYVDVADLPIRIRSSEYGKIVAWCDPYMERRYEVQGAVALHYEQSAVVIERAYVMGGNSLSLRTTCELDPEDMLRQMQAHYPERTQFMSHEVGWWHLHPGYYPALSVGDIEECRQVLRDCQASNETRVLQLLMYGDPRGGYQPSGYLVGLEEVNRLPVRIVEG